MLTKTEAHYLKCFDDNCEQVWCVDRREMTDKISKLKSVLRDIEFELENNVGLDSELTEENEKIEHRLLAFDAACTVCFRQKALGWIETTLVERAKEDKE